jgi:hypothetical protein
MKGQLVSGPVTNASLESKVPTLSVWAASEHWWRWGGGEGKYLRSSAQSIGRVQACRLFSVR